MHGGIEIYMLTGMQAVEHPIISFIRTEHCLVLRLPQNIFVHMHFYYCLLSGCEENFNQ